MPSKIQFGRRGTAVLPGSAISLSLMPGPTRYVEFTPKMVMSAVWNPQVWTREAGHSWAVDTAELRRAPSRIEIRPRILIWLNFGQGWYMSVPMIMIKNLFLAAVCATATLQASSAIAQDATEIQVTYSNGQFQPNELRAPADRPVVVKVRNLDPTAMEFESESLRVEKVVAGKTDGIISVRALKPGRYEFHDDFNDKARGALTVQ
jgi:hypothetical protein